MEGYNKLIIVGKGASGKDYLRKFFKQKDVSVSILHTTRPKRQGELHRKDYYFVSQSKFDAIEKEDSFLYTQNFNIMNPNNNEISTVSYGLTIKQFYKNRVHILTPHALKFIKPNVLNNCNILYLDIDREIRKERMIGRKKMMDQVERRLDADDNDFKDFTMYNSIITDPNFNAEDIYIDMMYSFEIAKNSN